MGRRHWAVITLWTLGAGILQAQMSNPADKQKESEEASARGRFRSWELPPITVEGTRESPLREEDRVGTYGQPRWTARRRFAETRLYVVPEGQFEFEYWLVPEFPKEGEREIKKQYEVEMGLPHHLQLDLYVVSHQEGNTGPLNFDEEKFEVRWAFADWGKIPTNPTVYLEWAAENEAPDHVEAKLLLGGEVTTGLHWGLNYVFEHETGAEMENSNELTGGVSYTVTDEQLSVGGEVKLALVDTKDTRGDFATELLVGPSLQYRPLPQMHIDLAPLVGVTDDSPNVKATLITGWEF